MDRLFPAERHRRPPVPPPGSSVAPVSAGAGAPAWPDAERPALVAMVACAAADGWPDRAAGDRAGEARVLQNLSLVDIEQGRYQLAAGRVGQALARLAAAGAR